MRFFACALVVLVAPVACIVVHDSVVGSPCNTDDDCGAAFCVDGICSLHDSRGSEGEGEGSIGAGEGEGSIGEGEGSIGEGEGEGSIGEGEGEGSVGEGEGEGSVGEGEGEGSTVDTSSCASILATGGSTGDGVYALSRGSVGLDVFCDMTHDGGGWMRVTPGMVEDDPQEITSVFEDNGNGLVATMYVNSFGCGDPQTPVKSVDLLVVDDVIPWTEVRYHEDFHGNEACWQIFGGINPALESSHASNLVAFDLAVDTIRDEVLMDGLNGDAFDGVDTRCDLVDQNFWHANTEVLRGATVINRRDDPAAPAGLRTEADCADNGPGTTSNGFFIYSDVFVR